MPVTRLSCPEPRTHAPDLSYRAALLFFFPPRVARPGSLSPQPLWPYVDRFSRTEVSGRLGIWLLEGNEEYSDLLRFALSKESWSTTMVVIALDFSKPWTLLTSALKWLGVVQRAWEALPLSAGDRDEAQERGTQQSARFKPRPQGLTHAGWGARGRPQCGGTGGRTVRRPAKGQRPMPAPQDLLRPSPLPRCPDPRATTTSCCPSTPACSPQTLESRS